MSVPALHEPIAAQSFSAPHPAFAFRPSSLCILRPAIAAMSTVPAEVFAGARGQRASEAAITALDRHHGGGRVGEAEDGGVGVSP